VALRPDQYIAPAPETKTSGGKKGGGRFGQAVGAVAGGVIGGMAAGAATGGAATGWGVAQGAMLGTAAGAGVGQALGEKVRPTVEATTAIERRAEAGQPQLMQSERTQKLKESIMALQSQPEAMRLELGKPLVAAYVKSYQDDMGAV
jgi:outer membrane lipoprotein SlyB